MKVVSERLIMAQISANDWPLFRTLHIEPEVISLCFDEPSEEELVARFESRLAPWSTKSNHWLCLVITERSTGEKLGVTGFCIQGGVAEVGFMFLSKFHGLGFGTESLKALIEYSKTRLGIDAFNAVVTEGNFGSERVLTKSGFTRVKVLPDAYEIGGKLYADHVYSLGRPYPQT